MEFMRRAKGSISIFLCIILLPMVTYSTMIIDASRMQVARTSIATAGDLAMNAALSEYEKVLQDMYGLFVLTENQESFENQLQAYFTETLEGKLTTTEKDLITGMSDEIVDAIINPNAEGKLNNLNNMLAMTVEEDAFDYVPIDGSTLANQAIMKRQIIEYMKYKGPVSLASTLLPKLDFLKDSSKQTEVVEMKVEYTKKLEALQDPCEKAWYLIEGAFDTNGACIEAGYKQLLEEYYALEVKDNFIFDNEQVYSNKDGKIIEGLQTRSWEYYKRMSQAILLDVNSKAASGLNWDALDTSAFAGWVNEKCEEYPSGDLWDYYTTYLNDTITSFYDVIDEQNRQQAETYGYINVRCSTYQDYKDRNTINVWFDPVTGNNASLESINAINGEFYNLTANSKLWAVRDRHMDDLKKFFDYQNTQSASVQEAINDNKYQRILAAKEYGSQIRDNYKQALDCLNVQLTLAKKEAEKDDEEEEEEESEETDSGIDIEALQAQYDEFEWNYEMMNAILSHSFWTDYSNAGRTLFNYVSDKSYYMDYAQEYASRSRDGWYEYYSKLEAMKEKCNAIISALGEIKTAITAAETAKSNWNTSIGQLSDGTTKTSMKSDLESTSDGIELADVETFITCITGIRDSISSRIDKIKEVKIFTFSLADNIDCQNSTLIKEAGKDVYKEYNESASQLFSRAIDITTNNFHRINVPEYKPTVIDGTPADNSQKFYLTLKSICETKKPEMTDTQSQQVEVINESAGGSGSSSAANAEEPTEATTDSANDNGAKELNIGEIYNTISAKSEENGLRADDDEESSDDSEGSSGDSKVKNVKISTNKDDYDGKAGDSTDSLKEGKNLLKTIGDLGAKVAEYAYMEEYFTEMFTCRTDATNKDGGIVLLNGYSIPAPGTDATTMAKTVNRNAPWFGREIEYIIWGDSNMNGNWVKTDALLYTIRFALNAIYAFTSPDIQAFALQVATAIAGWTVIGVPIVQACITVALALAESAYDLVLLHKGEDVAIYKSATTFVCSPSGIVSEAGKKVATELIDKGTKVAEKAIDNKIDEITGKVGATLEEKKQAALDYVAEYTAEQANEINTTIANMSVVPLMNQLMPVATEIDKKTDAKKDDLKTAVEAAVGKAFDSITKSINDMPNDNIVKPLAQLVYTKEFKDRLKTKVSGYFTKEFDSATEFSAVNKLYELKAYLIDDTVDENSEGIISKEIWKWNDDINGAVQEKAKVVIEKIEGVTEETADNLKSAMHEGFDDMSAKLSGTVTKTLDDAAEKLNLNKVKDASASKGFTLNYKEYCKIFVLVKLAAGQEPKMLNRAAALIEANVRTANGTNNTEFRIVDGYTLVGIKSNVKMGTLFPWGVSVSDSSDTTGSVDMSLDLNNLGENFVTINYQAVNGY